MYSRYYRRHICLDKQFLPLAGIYLFLLHLFRYNYAFCYLLHSLLNAYQSVWFITASIGDQTFTKHIATTNGTFWIPSGTYWILGHILKKDFLNTVFSKWEFWTSQIPFKQMGLSEYWLSAPGKVSGDSHCLFRMEHKFPGRTDT